MEIKVGDYVRTKDEGIAKVLEIKQSPLRYVIDKYENIVCEEDITKHSKNIIDLIEVGDIVNGMIVEEFDDEEGNLYLGFPIYDDALMNCIEETRPLNTIDIKSILTHEQYKENAYEVEEEKC